MICVIDFDYLSTHNMIYVGIDPDIDKSGIGIIDTTNKVAVAHKMDEIEILEYFKHTSTAKFFIETQQTTHNFHGKTWQTKAAYGKIMLNVGQNLQEQKVISRLLNKMGADIAEVPPLVKSWRGSDRKITHEEINEILKNAGYNEIKRCSQDMRDALLLAINHGGVPIRVSSNFGKLKLL